MFGMKINITIFVASFLILLSGGNLQAVEVTAKLDRTTISLGEQATLKVSVLESQVQNEPEFPPLNDFTVYSAGQTFSSTYVNGKMTSSVEYRYILIPRKTGKFKIGPIQIKAEGKEYKTDALYLTVGGVSSSGQSSNREDRDRPSQTDRKNYLISAEVSKDTVYEGEQFVYSFKAHKRAGANFLELEYFPPSYSGFYREDFGWKQYNVRYQGDIFTVSQMNSYLFPVTVGEVTINPTRVVVKPDNFTGILDFDLFDPQRFHSRAFRNPRPETLYTEPKTVNVLPLPREDRPPDFKGSVGDFNMVVDLSSTDVTVDETILMVIRISGTGNIKSISPPEIPLIEGLDIIPSGDSMVIQEAAGLVAGNKTYEYSIIPEEDGYYEIPQLSWSYFDPKTESYRNHKSQLYKITVTPGASVSEDPLTGLITPQADLKAKDILAVKPLRGELKSYDSPLLYNSTFLAIQAVPILLLAGAFFIRRRQEKIMGILRYGRLNYIGSIPKKHLRNARKLLANNMYDEFCGEVSKALYECISNKFNLSSSGLTMMQAKDILGREGYSEDLIESFAELMQATDFGRFAPGEAGGDDAHMLIEKAERWIAAFEQEGKRGR